MPSDKRQNTKMTCDSLTSQTNPAIRANADAQQLKSEYTVSGKMATANLEMQAKRDDNGKEFRCEATNPALDVPLVDKVTLRVECKLLKRRYIVCHKLPSTKSSAPPPPSV